MKTTVRQALLQLILANLALTRHPEGSHSLRFLQTLFTWPGLLEPQFIIVTFVDDMQFERLDSRTEPLRMEHCAPWVDQETSEYWEEKTQNMLRLMDFYNDVLKKMLHFYNQSENGNHTIQSLLSCDVLPGGNFSHGRYELLFNDRDYIALNEDLSTWTTVGKAAEILRQELEESGYGSSMKFNLEVGCVQLLLRQLDYGKEIFLETDALKIHVTYKVRADGNITLRCWALDFYPAEITLTWQRDGSNQNLDMEVIETRPTGDGTFQKWAAVVVPAGEEQKYTCHVHHEGLLEPLTLRWEPPQPSVPITTIVTGLVLGAVFMGAVVTFLIWKRRTKE